MSGIDICIYIQFVQCGHRMRNVDGNNNDGWDNTVHVDTHIIKHTQSPLKVLKRQGTEDKIKKSIIMFVHRVLILEYTPSLRAYIIHYFNDIYC